GPASDWRKTGESILIAEAERQFTEEGVHGELSSTYHCYALDFYLQAICLARHNSSIWPERTWRSVEQRLHFLMHLTRPDGTSPRLGDDDGGRAVALRETSYRSSRGALCCGAVLFDRGDFKSVATLFCEEALWLLGADGWRHYSSLAPRSPREKQA